MANGFGDHLKLTDLPPAALRRVLAYLSNKQLVCLRLVNRSLKAAATDQLNAAFFEVEGLLERQLGRVLADIQIENRDKSDLFLRYRTLRVALCEFRVLLAVCWRRLVLAQSCFTGDVLLDLLHRVCSPRAALSDDDAATMYHLCGVYLDHEDALATCLRCRDFGVEVVDLLDCLVSCNHRVFVSSKGRARRISGNYEAAGELDLGVFPDIEIRRVASGQELTPRGITQLIRFLRNAIRWNNFIQCIDESLETSLSRALKVRLSPQGPSEDAQNTFVRHVGDPGRDTGLSVTVNLVCDVTLGPLRLRKRGKLPRKFTDVPIGESSSPSKYELSLAVKVKCGPKDIHKLGVFQDNDGTCMVTKGVPQRI